MKLNPYAQQKLKKVFWQWYLQETDNGMEQFVKLANVIVLYTNVNKTTVFYRLLMNIRDNRKKIPIGIRRTISFINVFTKLFFERAQKSAFDKLKQQLQLKKL